jgi:hypothetical protein
VNLDNYDHLPKYQKKKDKVTDARLLSRITQTEVEIGEEYIKAANLDAMRHSLRRSSNVPNCLRAEVGEKVRIYWKVVHEEGQDVLLFVELALTHQDAKRLGDAIRKAR